MIARGATCQCWGDFKQREIALDSAIDRATVDPVAAPDQAG